jgi:hypothetical protein
MTRHVGASHNRTIQAYNVYEQYQVSSMSQTLHILHATLLRDEELH